MTTHLPLIASVGNSYGLLIVLVSVVGAGLVFGLIWLRHHYMRRRVATRFAGFKEHVVQLRERVEAIKERHKLLPVSDKDFQEPMTGATLALYTQIQQDFSRLWDKWLERMDIWEQIQRRLESQRFLGVSQLKEADRLLDKLGAFQEIDRVCQTCDEQLDQLEQGHEQAQKMFGQAGEQPGQLRRQMESVAHLPLPTTPHETELAACAELTEQGRRLLRADPIGAQEVLKQCLTRLTALGQRLDDVVRLFHQAREAQNTLEQVTRQAAERRACGLLLTEPEANPDPVLEQGRTRHGGLLQALERGDPQTAAGHLEQALALAERARSTIERHAAAREQCLREIPAWRAAGEQLRQLTSTAQSQRRELESSFAPDSWRAVADNAASAVALQGTADALLGEAASASAETLQHYFRAAGLLEQVQRQQEQARTQLADVGRCLHQLTQVRQECMARRQDLVDQARTVTAYFAAHMAAVRKPTRSRLDGAAERWRQVRGQMEVRRPHWPQVQQQMEETRKEFAAAHREAEEDVRTQQQFAARLHEVGREAERVGHHLQQNWEDRQQANERYRSAVEALERVRREGDGKAAEWKVLLQQVEEAASALRQAEELARQDLQLSDRAAAAIEAAERELARVRGFFQLGITADLARSEQLLANARLKLAEQAYEQAHDQAGAAQQAARQAHDDAAARAQQQQQRLDQEHQRLEAAALGTPTAPPSAIAQAGMMSWPNPAEQDPEAPPKEPG